MYLITLGCCYRNGPATPGVELIGLSVWEFRGLSVPGHLTPGNGASNASRTTYGIPSCIAAVQMFCHPFQIDEVFRCIVEQLVTPRSLRSALSLAMCCKSLTDLSLSALWERQKRLSTLIKVLPPDAWTYRETDSDAGELVGHPRSHGSFRAQYSLLCSIDDLTRYHIAGMGKVEEVRVVDARTRISRG